jgi:hypothetical protein
MQTFFDAFVQIVGGLDLAILILACVGAFLFFRFISGDAIILATLFLYPAYLLVANISWMFGEKFIGLPSSIAQVVLMIAIAVFSASILQKNGFFETYSVPTGFELMLFSIVFAVVGFALSLNIVGEQFFPLSSLLRTVFVSQPWSLIALFSPFIIGFVIQSRD